MNRSLHLLQDFLFCFCFFVFYQFGTKSVQSNQNLNFRQTLNTKSGNSTIISEYKQVEHLNWNDWLLTWPITKTSYQCTPLTCCSIIIDHHHEYNMALSCDEDGKYLKSFALIHIVSTKSVKKIEFRQCQHQNLRGKTFRPFSFYFEDASSKSCPFLSLFTLSKMQEEKSERKIPLCPLPVYCLWLLYSDCMEKYTISRTHMKKCHERSLTCNATGTKRGVFLIPNNNISSRI